MCFADVNKGKKYLELDAIREQSDWAQSTIYLCKHLITTYNSISWNCTGIDAANIQFSHSSPADIHFLMLSFCCELKSQGKILFARLGFAAQRVLPNIPNQRLKLNLVLLKCAIKTQSGWI
jgi:hypothetical protein